MNECSLNIEIMKIFELAARRLRSSLATSPPTSFKRLKGLLKS